LHYLVEILKGPVSHLKKLLKYSGKTTPAGVSAGERWECWQSGALLELCYAVFLSCH
jgi:hypothetical protein